MKIEDLEGLGFEVHTINPGNNVICDFCDEDWTTRPESGGFLFQSKATCPDCAPGMEENARKYSELNFIRARCPEDKSFADWVRDDLRGGKNGDKN